MAIPERIPGLRLATVLAGLYAVVWISLEGSLFGVLTLSLILTVVIAGRLVQGTLAGHSLPAPHWLVLCTAGGLASGWFFTGLALLLMGVKSGLHDHGPEFTLAQITWVSDQVLVWGLAGMLGGLGFGLVGHYVSAGKQ